jgi:hypothetical protein
MPPQPPPPTLVAAAPPPPPQAPPPPSYPPPLQAARRRLSGRVLAAGAAMAALLLLGAGLGNWLGGRDDDGMGVSTVGNGSGGRADAPQPGSMELLWQQPPSESDGGGFLGAWYTDSEQVSVTTGSGGGIAARRLDDGEESWTAEPPPGAQGGPCAASAEPNAAGAAAVAYSPTGSADNCTILAAVDTASGELLWHRDFAADGAPASMTGLRLLAGPETFSAEAYMDSDKTVLRFAATDGALRDTVQLPPLPPDAEDCDEARYVAAGTEHLVIARTVDCGYYGYYGGETFVYDTDTGEMLHKADEAVFVESVLTTDPLVVTADEYDDGYDDYDDYTTSLELRALPGTGDSTGADWEYLGGGFEAPDTDWDGYADIAAFPADWLRQGDILYGVTASEYDGSRSVTTYSLATLEELWSDELGSDGVLAGATEDQTLTVEGDGGVGGRWIYLSLGGDSEGSALLPGSGNTSVVAAHATAERLYLHIARDGGGTAVFAYSRNLGASEPVTS